MNEIFGPLKEIREKYKHIIKRVIKVNDNTIGITTTVSISCSCFNLNSIIDLVASNFKGKNMNNEITYQNNFNWYDLNLKLALCALASGKDTSSMAQLLSVINIPNAKSLNRRFT